MWAACACTSPNCCGSLWPFSISNDYQQIIFAVVFLLGILHVTPQKITAVLPMQATGWSYLLTSVPEWKARGLDAHAPLMQAEGPGVYFCMRISLWCQFYLCVLSRFWLSRSHDISFSVPRWKDYWGWGSSWHRHQALPGTSEGKVQDHEWLCFGSTECVWVCVSVNGSSRTFMVGTSLIFLDFDSD